MKQKRCRLLIVVLAAVFVFTSCNLSHTTQDAKVPEQKKQYQIGLSFDSFVIERWLRDRDAFVSTANKLGAEVNVQNANGDLQEQISQIEYFIKKKMDVIVVIAVDCKGLNSVIEKARRSGIKIVSYDRLIKGVDTDLYISFDNEKVGQEMAQAMATALPQGGNIASIMGPESDNNVLQIKDGFENVLKQTNVTIKYTANCDKWDADEAPKYTEEAISEVPDLCGIVCGNDDIATQVSKTLAEHRLSGKIIIVGQDADLLACQRIVEGTQTMTVFKQVENMESIAADFSVELAKGEDITNKGVTEGYFATETIDNDKSQIPYYSLDPIVVTKDNLDSVIIDSGFHDRSEVYLNMQDTATAK